MATDYDKIQLLFREKVFLFSLRFKRRPLPLNLEQLRSPLGLVEVDHSKAQLSEKYFRYRAYRRDLAFQGRLPAIIAVIALVEATLSLMLSTL